MAKQIKKPKKVEEPDLLPAMGLFTILIPMLLTMTAFSKLAIVGAKLNCKDADKARDMMVAASDAVFLTEAPRLTRYISIISVMASISVQLDRRNRYDPLWPS